ncbi:MAG: glycosyltransferase family 2 protein [Pseudomonadota bacterium]
MNADVLVVVLNWRNAADTLACLDSLMQSTHRAFRVVVCDNRSGDGSTDAFLRWASAHAGAASQHLLLPGDPADRVAREFEHQVVWLDTGANAGYAGGNNAGIRAAMHRPDWRHVWILNNDCTVAPDAMAQLLARTAADPSIGICGATLVYADTRRRVQAWGGAVHNPWTGRAFHLGHLSDPASLPRAEDVEPRLSYVCGASMFVSRQYLETVGLMAEDYFLYFEEIDWALRGQGRFHLGYAPSAIVHHKEGASIGTHSDTRKTSALSDKYLFRNRLKFTRRFYPLAVPTVWLVMLLQAMRRGLRGQTDRMLLILRILLGREPA